MTLVVAIVSDTGSVVFGSDSGGYFQDTKELRKEPKVFLVHGCLFGFAGNFRIGQLIQYSLADAIGCLVGGLQDAFEVQRNMPALKHINFDELPQINEASVLLQSMITTFIPSLIRLLKKQGCLKVEDHIKNMDCEILIGIPKYAFTSRGYIFKIEANFQISEVHSFGCIGAASPYALGALGAIKQVQYMDAHDAAKLGLEIAAQHSSVVMEPFVIQEI